MILSLSEILISLELGIIYGIVAIGIYLTFRIINFPDLTCDGSFVCGAAVSTMALKAGWNPALAVLAAAAAGALAGGTTGLVYLYGRVTDLLSGILVAFMLYSINLRIMGGVPNIALLQEGTLFTYGYNQALTLMFIAFVLWFGCRYLLKTDFGLALRSIGQNVRLSENNGVNIAKMTMIGLILSNMFIGFGGGLFSQHQGFTDISQGLGTVIIGLAAVTIGEKIFAFSTMGWHLFACLMGSILYRLIMAVALHNESLGLDTSDLNLITGLILIGIMRIPSMRRAK
ncbi:MAG: ABC transporter permease [Janthinobacterium lividum]